jgi:hypothetical protein
MERKICSKCSIDKELCDFGKNTYGVNSQCKECKRKYDQEYRKKNKQRIDERNKNWNEQNKEWVSQRKLNWSRENKDRINKKLSDRKKNDPQFKLKTLYRSKLNKILGSNRESTFELIGCSSLELKIHLEQQFVVGMEWDNHGVHGWHIDHIIPLSSAKNNEELKKLCHYTNLQPLWWWDNLEKRDKIPLLTNNIFHII